MGLFNKTITKFSHPVRGLYLAFTTDLSFRLNILLGVGLLIFGYLVWPLSMTEMVFLFLSWSLLLITELQNTAMETALDKIHPERHSEIGKSKDISAASVLVSLIFIAVVVFLIFMARN